MICFKDMKIAFEWSISFPKTRNIMKTQMMAVSIGKGLGAVS